MEKREARLRAADALIERHKDEFDALVAEFGEQPSKEACLNCGRPGIKELSDYLGHDRLGHRVRNALWIAGIKNVDTLEGYTFNDDFLLSLRNFGKTALARVQSKRGVRV